jgi:Methyltransferase domain
MLCSFGFNFFRQSLHEFNGNHVEIGIFKGDGIRSIADCFPEKMMYGIDPFIEDGHTCDITKVVKGGNMDNVKTEAMSYIDGRENIHLFEMTSADFADMLTDENIQQLDVTSVLIDGSHWYNDVVIDGDLAVRLIADKKGVIVFDDTEQPGVGQALEEFKVKYKDIITNTTDLLPGIVQAVYING